MGKMIKKLLCLMMVLVTIFSTAVMVSAASTKKITTCGDSYAAKVVQIKTDKSTKLVFKQAKGTYTYQNWFMGISKNNSYGDFYIYVVDESGKEAPKKYDCSFKSSVTISLKANKTYTITVCANSESVTYNKLVRSGKLWYKAPYCNSIDWTKLPSWTLTVNKAISMKTIKTVRTPQG